MVSNDINSDGKPDIIVAEKVSQQVDIFLNNGDGTFTEQMINFTGDTLRFLTVADVNSDGNIDIIVISIVGNKMRILFNDGNGTFTEHMIFFNGNTPSEVCGSRYE
jgi:hypothetical protein